MMQLMRKFLSHESDNSPALTIAPGTDLGRSATTVESNEAKRLAAIAHLDQKWVLAKTRQDFLAELAGLV